MTPLVAFFTNTSAVCANCGGVWATVKCILDQPAPIWLVAVAWLGHILHQWIDHGKRGDD